MNSAIILAAGKARRFNSSIPKQFMTIDGRQVLSFSVKTFSDHPGIDEIIITAGEKDIVQVRADYPECKVVPGGETRQESTIRGMEACSSGSRNVLVHDSARPFVTQRIITCCLDMLEKHDGAAPIRPVQDSIIKETEGRAGYMDRSTIKVVQTPQAFRSEVLKAAHDSGFESTDQVGLVYLHNPDADIGFFEGDSFNFKITTRMDLYFAEQLMRNRVYLNPSGFDGTGKTALVLGGTSGIGKAIADRLLSYGVDVTMAGSEIQVQNPGSLDRFLDRRWDIIIHSMGVMKIGSKSIITLVENLSYNEWDEGVKINLTSAFLAVKLAMETMKNGGHLLFIGSSAAKRGRKNFALYSAAKAGLVNFVQSVAEELQDRRIMVNLINPSRTFTKMRSVFTGEDPTKMLKPERVAEIATAYCHGRLTGQIFDLRVGE